MKTIEALIALEMGIKTVLFNIKSEGDIFPSQELSRVIKQTIFRIREKFKINYTRRITMKKSEEKRLKEMLIRLINHGEDDFNSYYIKLLAWNISDLKILGTPSGNKAESLSIMEYQPSDILSDMIIDRVFSLFLPAKIDPEKVTTGLLLSYLNNSERASKAFKIGLKSYLKIINYDSDIDIYFFTNTYAMYLHTGMKTLKYSDALFPDRWKYLKIKTELLDSSYFISAWFSWMFQIANLKDYRILAQLNTFFFNKCTLFQQKLLYAKIIYDNYEWSSDYSHVLYVWITYIAPTMKNLEPFTQEYWHADVDKKNRFYFDRAYSIIEKMLNDHRYKHMLTIKEEHKIK